ncbi:DNA polymerase I [Formicincola oecophyllae]|uniref:DNA polymerase I n=1 Tax=Formicincola oecophyllae TaxID=2558361 RepID=A0A4Y6UAE1_9PROT|nr:DNA polymerase I [Formicincola oecophyllae]QDH14433.1 DNA polymerase I [Formicincola oecophyllae]
MTTAAGESQPSTRPLILVDGSGVIFRAFHALPASMTSPDGTPVNAVYGFANALAGLAEDYPGHDIAVVFDAARHTFRNDIYPDYKAHRPPAPDDLVPQFPLVREAAQAFGLQGVELEGWEADDIIATYTRQAVAMGRSCTIMTSDKDLMQLVGPLVRLMDPVRQTPMGEGAVLKKFGVSPDKVVDVQALMGDPSDNVPGVPGIGPKNAALLIGEHGTLEAVLEAAPTMKPSKRRQNLIDHADMARISKKLVTLADNVPVPIPLAAISPAKPDLVARQAWLERMGFASLIRRLNKSSGRKGQGSGAGSTPAQQGQGTLFNPNPTRPGDASGQAVGVVLTPPLPEAGWDNPPTLIESPEVLKTWLEVAQQGGQLAIRVESDPVQPPQQAMAVGIGLARSPGETAYVPLVRLAPQPAKQGEGQAALLEGQPQEAAKAEVPLTSVTMDPAPFMAVLQPVLNDPSTRKIFHDAKTAQTLLASLGAVVINPDLPAVDDVMLMSYAQKAGAHSHDLAELAQRHLQHSLPALEGLTGKGRGRKKPSELVPEVLAPHSAEQADAILRLRPQLATDLLRNRSTTIYEEMERPLIPTLMRMEQAGIAVDKAKLEELSADFTARMGVLEGAIHKVSGPELNVGSPKQLGEVLFDTMALPGGKKTKAGNWSTDSAMLESLLEQPSNLPPGAGQMIQDILAWRQLAKLKSTYTDALLNLMREGRIHTTFHMAATTTGRLSSNDPNLQNIPIRTAEGARLREAFVAPPGRKLVSADYSQIELRLLAHVAGIEPLLDAFARGQDIHARTASEVFGVPLESMDAATRRKAKAINFGIIYGISPFGLARQLGISQGQAKAYIDAYFERYPGIKAYMERTKQEGARTGQVSSPFGRLCHVPGMLARNGTVRAYAERQAINAPLQGGAADIIKRAMVRLDKALPQSGLEGRMILQVHDELLFEVPESQAEALAALAKREMEAVAHLKVKLEVETGIGDSWSEAH